MIFDAVQNFSRYNGLNKSFSQVDGFLKSNDLFELNAGRHEISQEVFVISEMCKARSVSDAPLEAHRKYIDVQFCLNAIDRIGWASIDACDAPRDPYDPKRDLVFFNDEFEKQIALSEGFFAIFFPWDAHAPNVGSGEFHKIIFKVLVD